MTEEEIKTLTNGDIVRSKISGTAWQVFSTVGKDVVLVRTITLTHPSEWEVVAKVSYEKAES